MPRLICQTLDPALAHISDISDISDLRPQTDPPLKYRAGQHNSVAHLIADWGWESDYIQQMHLKASKTFTSSNC